MEVKTLLAVIASTIAVVSYIPYLWDIRHNKTKPHAFSWFTWSLLGFIAGYAEFRAGGGIGASVVLVSATISLCIAYIAHKQGSVKITRSDWITFVAALLAIVLLIVTRRPLLSVITASISTIVGFWPTIRKSLIHPHDETLSTYFLSTVRQCLTIAALQHFNLTTVLYPASLAITTGLFVLMLLVLQLKCDLSSDRILS